MIEIRLHYPNHNHFPLYGNDGHGAPICGGDLEYIQNLLSDALQQLGCDSLSFMGTLAVDWLDKSGKELHRIARLDVEAQFNQQEAPNAYEHNKIFIASQHLRHQIDDSFDLAAMVEIANHLGWLNIPAQNCLYTVPDNLCHTSDIIKLREGEGSMFLTILSTKEHEDLIMSVLSYIRQGLRQSGNFCDCEEFIETEDDE